MRTFLQRHRATLWRSGMLCMLAAVLSLCPGAHAAPAPAAPKTIVIGLIPELNIFRQKERFQPLEEYLSKKAGVPVHFTVLSRYGNIIDRFAAGDLDGAFFGSFTGALAIRKLGIVPLARPLNEDHTSTYQGYIFVRKDSGITKAAAMKGKRMAFVDKATTAGYIFPLAWLRENGIPSPDGFFREQFFTGSHDASIGAVLNGKADVGAAKHSVYEQVRMEEPRVERELVVIARSPWVPSNGLCVRKDLDPGLQKALKEALLGLDREPEGKQILRQLNALSFIETTAKDYEPVFDLVRKAGIDIRTYQYRNE
jgi:phosphonate transport system substrate-binding protein